MFFLRNLYSDNKHILGVDVEIIEDGLKNNIITVKVNTLAGMGQPLPVDDIFEEDDYWNYGEGLGKCGDYSGYAPRDAAYEIQYRINHNNTEPTEQENNSPVPHLRYFFIDVDELPDFIYPWDVEYEIDGDGYIDNNFLDSYLFINTPENDDEGDTGDDWDKCMEPYEMNWHLDKAYFIIDNELSKLNEGITDTDLQRSFVSSTIEGRPYEYDPNIILHRLNFEHGVKISILQQ